MMIQKKSMQPGYIIIAAAVAVGLASCHPVAGIFGLGGTNTESPAKATEQTDSTYSTSISGDLPSNDSYGAKMLHRQSAVVGDTLYYLTYDSYVYDYLIGYTYTWRINSLGLGAGGSGIPTTIATVETKTGRPGLAYVPAASSLSGAVELVLVYSYSQATDTSTYTQTYSLSLLRVRLDGSSETLALSAEAAAPFADTPLEMAADASGNLYFLTDASSATSQAAVVKLSPDKAHGTYALAWSFGFVNMDTDVNQGSLQYQYQYYYRPLGIAVAADGSKVYVACDGDDEADSEAPWDGVYVLDGSTGILDEEASRFDRGVFSAPAPLAVGAEGGLYAYNARRRTVECYDQSLESICYATKEAWLMRDADGIESGAQEPLVIVPGADGFALISLSGSTLSAEFFSLP